MGWINDHKRFTTVVGILLALSLLVSFSYSQKGQTTFVGHVVQKTVSVVTKPITKAADGVGDFFYGITHSRELEKENEELREQIAELEAENRQLKADAIEAKELEKLYEAFDFKPYKPGDAAVAGRVTSTDLSNPYVVFTIDRGRESGIEKNCIVVDGNGLVGRVIDTGKGWSKVSSVLSDSNDISFYTLRDKTVTGIVSGDGKDGMAGYVMDDSYRIIKGDELVTTGVGTYPGGIPIGTVKDVEYDADRQLRTITVEPTCSFRGMQKVVVFL